MRKKTLIRRFLKGGTSAHGASERTGSDAVHPGGSGESRRAWLRRTVAKARVPPPSAGRAHSVYLWDPAATADLVEPASVRAHRRPLWPWLLTGALVLGGCTWAVVQADQPPALLLDQTRRAISGSVQLEANEWAPEMIAAAEESLKAASREIDHQITRFFVIRNYDTARAQALEAQRLARAALPLTVARRDSMRVVANDRIKQAREALDTVRGQMAGLELSTYNRAKVTMLEIARKEALGLAGQGKFRLADQRAREVLAGVVTIEGDIDDQIGDYVRDRHIWDRWVRDTIDWSRRNEAYAIVVRKLDHRCDLYHAGNLKASYPAELGIRWMGHKTRAGDCVTPEGRYQISDKKAASRYYRALEINYPNDEDRARFARLKAQGKISKRASIGGLIEIHGHGGRGKDWTQGCVALRNDQMDQLFSRVGVGTPVTIVGDWDPREAGGSTAR